MKQWARGVGTAIGFLLFLCSGLLYFLAGLVVRSPMIPVIWTGWAILFGLTLVWRRRPLMVLLMPVFALAFLTAVIIVAGLLFGRSGQPLH